MKSFMSQLMLNITPLAIGVVSLTVACSTMQPLAESTDEKPLDSLSVKPMYTEVSTIDDDVIGRTYALGDIPLEQLRIIHAEQVSRLTKGTAEKPIIDGMGAALKLFLKGAGSGRAPMSMSVDAPRNGRLKIRLVNIGTSEVTTLSDVGVSKGINDVPLNFGSIASGAYTIRISEGALTASAGFNVAK